MSRCFYVRTSAVEFSGYSPELLADGDVSCFRTHKLSGTYARSEALAEDVELRARFEADPKIRTEHALSNEATRAALTAVGEVKSGKRVVLELPRLRHFMTTLGTRPRRGARIGDCLRGILPSGAYPEKEGLQLLRTIETHARGAYYGIVGIIEPGGRFSFSQTLRTVFRDKYGCYLWVGAAVTKESDAALEYAETRIKLAGMQVMADGPACE